MSVSIFVVRAVVETVERAGVSRLDLFARTPLDGRDLLERTDMRLELEDFGRVLEAALTLTGDEAFALHMAESMSERAFDLPAHLVAHAPTMREAAIVASQFGSLAMDGLVLHTYDEGNTFIVRCAFPRSTPLRDRLLAELMMAGIVRLARTFTSPRVEPRLAWFEHERPGSHPEYTRIFGKDLQFGQSETLIAFDRELADRPQIHRHAELYSLLRAEAGRRLDGLAKSVSPSARLHQFLLATPLSRLPDIATAARDLGMSERSLRRHLAAEGTSYRNAVRSVLESSAGRLLRDPKRTIKETAVALGFADSAAFHHAFKRWTGMTPTQFRAGVAVAATGSRRPALPPAKARFGREEQ